MDWAARLLPQGGSPQHLPSDGEHSWPEIAEDDPLVLRSDFSGASLSSAPSELARQNFSVSWDGSSRHRPIDRLQGSDTGMRESLAFRWRRRRRSHPICCFEGRRTGVIRDSCVDFAAGSSDNARGFSHVVDHLVAAGRSLSSLPSSSSSSSLYSNDSEDDTTELDSPAPPVDPRESLRSADRFSGNSLTSSSQSNAVRHSASNYSYRRPRDVVTVPSPAIVGIELSEGVAPFRPSSRIPSSPPPEIGGASQSTGSRRTSPPEAPNMAWLPSQVRRRCPRFVRSAAQAGSGIVRRAMGSCRRSAVWRRWRRRGIHVCRRIFKCLNRAEGWLHAALVATLAALSAAWISIAVKYLSDLRLGVCQGMFWLDRSFCCGDEQAINYDVNACAAEHSPEVHMDHVVHARWMSWAVWLGLARGGAAAFVVDHLAYVCISTALAGTAAWLVRRFAHRAAGSGIPEIKTALNGFWIPGVLSMWTLVVKCVGLALAASSGLSLGKEGPLVHVACAWAALLDKFRLKVLRRRNPSLEMSDGRLRELLSAACSAGVSVAFGAPLGGVLFALEEVSSHFPPRTLWKCFFCAVVAALTLKSLDSEGTGNLTLFQMDYISLLGSWEPVQIFSFCFLGLIGGALGALFIRLNIAWDRIKTSDPFVSSHPVTVVVAIAVVTSAINYLIPMLKGSSLLLLQQLFGRCGIPGRSSAAVDPFHLCAAPNDPEAEYTDYSLSFGIFVEMTFVLIIRFAQTVFTFGTAVPAGIFIPSLTIGALAGRMVGLVMIKINASTSFLDCHKCIQPGIYALVGAAAVLGGVTRMTISLVVIMFELTGGLAYVVPFMASVMIAKWTADFFEPDGIYDAYIRIKRYPYLSAHDSGHQATFDGTVKDVMRRDFVCLYLEGETFGSATRKLTSVEGNLSLPLVSDASSLYLLGYVEASTLRRSLRHYRTRHEGTNNTVITFSKYAAEWRDVRRKIDRMSSLMPTRPVHAGAYAFGVAAGGEYGRPRSRSESGSSGFGGGNTQALDTRARRSRQGGRYGRVATSGDAEAFADTGVPRLPGVTNRPFADRRASQLRRSSFSDTSMTTSSGDDDEDGGQFAVGEEGDDDGGELSPPSRPASAGLPEGPPNGDRRGGQGSEAAAALQTARTTMTTPSNHHLELVSVDLTFLVCQFTFQLSPDTPLPDAHKLFHNFALSCCFPTTAGRLEGVLTKTDLVQRVMQRQQQQNAEGTTRHRRILRAAAAARRSHWPRLAGIFRRNGGGNAAQQHEQIVLAG